MTGAIKYLDRQPHVLAPIQKLLTLILELTIRLRIVDHLWSRPLGLLRAFMLVFRVVTYYSLQTWKFRDSCIKVPSTCQGKKVATTFNKSEKFFYVSNISL